MKKLKDLLNDVDAVEVVGSWEVEVEGLAFDSRKVKNGFVFFAITGTHVDGHNFIQTAIHAGASAIICENKPNDLSEGVSYIVVDDSAKTLGLAAAAFFDYPSQKMKLIGVTGTNGKTTIASLLYKLALNLGYRAGLISTISYMINERNYVSSHTTPDQLQLNHLMSEMVDDGCDYCFMEVSSHSIDQKRIAGLDFDGAIFTNITHDHLDYHKTFDAYIKAKKQFFDLLKPEAFALTNIDDKNGRIMMQNTKALQKSYSLQSLADFKCKILEAHFDGTLMTINGKELWTHFVGRFNAYNLLAVYGAATMLGFENEEVLIEMSKLVSVAGRFEVIRSLVGTYAIVDYAHTPDALENVLSTITDIRSKNEQLICLLGAGGDRDKSKRPEMAAIACKYSDKIILTSDNPRTEDPATILQDMEAGVDPVNRKNTLVISDRRQAIKTAAMIANPGDIILVAGKGHEDYQEVNGVKHHFDDREEVKKIFGLI